MRASVVDVFKNGTGAGNTRREPNVSGLEGRTIVYATGGNANDLTEIAVCLNVNFLILRERSGQDLETG
jgi:hypothetical protein